MRPLKRNILQTGLDVSRYGNERKSIQWQLLESFGDYCSYCEMPLGQKHIEHHRLKKTWQEDLSGQDWEHLLLICYDCRHHQCNDFLYPEDVSDYIWPDRDRSFSLHEDYTPFLYEKIVIEHIVHERGNQRKREKKFFIRIKANPCLDSDLIRKAQNTIDLFQLNTPYFEPDRNRVFIPLEDHLKLMDNRANQRLSAWTEAEDAVDRLKLLHQQTSTLQEHPELLNHFHDLISKTAIAKGNWSVWMTVFWEAFRDKELIEALFVEDKSKEPHQLHFAGTHKDLLLYD